MAISLTFHAPVSYGAGPRTVAGSAVVANTLIKGFIVLDDDSQTPSVSDNLSTPTVYSWLPTLSMPTSGVTIRPFVGVTTVSGTPTITIDVPNHSGIRGAVLAFGGFGGTPTSIITASDATGSTSPLTYSVSPGADNVLIAIAANESFYSHTAVSPWTISDDGAGGRPDLAYSITASGAHSGSVATIGAAATWYTRTYAYGLSGGSDSTQTPTGFGLTASLGTPALQKSSTKSVSGFGLSMSLGSPSIATTGNKTLNPSGFGLTASLGTPALQKSTKALPSGFGLSMSLGTFTVQRDTTILGIPGFGLSMSLGTPGVATSGSNTRTPTGFGLTASLGTPAVTVSETKPTSGFGLGITLGSPTVLRGSTITPAGFGLAIALGTPAVQAAGPTTAHPFGFALVASLGSPAVNIVASASLLLGTIRQLDTTPRVRQVRS